MIHRGRWSVLISNITTGPTMNFTVKPLSFVFAALAAPSIAVADLRVSFIEGAPKDRFEIVNIGACALAGSSVLLDLSTSAAGLIFDVTDQGAGVEVFQPLEIVAGAEALVATPAVQDGQNQIQFDIASLSPGQAIGFTIDVDDTRGTRAITVSRSEIEGAQVVMLGTDTDKAASFTRDAVADLALDRC